MNYIFFSGVWMFLAFIIVLAVEFFIVWLFTRKPKQTLLYVVLINLFTWPLANFLFFVLKGLGAYQFLLFYLILVEILVIVIEAILLWKLLNMRYSRAFLASIAANIVTGILPFLFLFLGMPFMMYL